MKKKKIINPKPTRHAKVECKTGVSFYKVMTRNRTFYAQSKKDIYANIHDDDYTFEVSYIEYIGFYEGKEDVIRIRTNDEDEYLTAVDVNTCALYYKYDYNESEKTVWKILRDYSVQSYYEKFKSLGVNLKNDLYKRNNDFKAEVSRQINTFKK